MSREHTIELVSSDKRALCVLFVEGRIAAAAHGMATANVRPGQQVRYFVRPRRRNARFTVQEHRNGLVRTVAEGLCDRILETGEHVCPKGPFRAGVKAPMNAVVRQLTQPPLAGRIDSRPAAAALQAEAGVA